jgi:hypothetical protein
LRHFLDVKGLDLQLSDLLLPYPGCPRSLVLSLGGYPLDYHSLIQPTTFVTIKLLWASALCNQSSVLLT